MTVCGLELVKDKCILFTLREMKQRVPDHFRDLIAGKYMVDSKNSILNSMLNLSILSINEYELLWFFLHLLQNRPIISLIRHT
jgi:hypothetical protein